MTKTKTQAPTCKQIAHAIDGYLKMFEADPNINVRRVLVDGEWQVAPTGKGVGQYYFAHAVAHGRFVRITYISYQGSRALTKAEAATYLTWLQAGNVGTHHNMKREP